jgi:hypothetical protein
MLKELLQNLTVNNKNKLIISDAEVDGVQIKVAYANLSTGGRRVFKRTLGGRRGGHPRGRGAHKAF